MNYENDPRSIKYHVKKYLLDNAAWFKGKTVVDIPAGNGITSQILKETGAKPLSFDLFPEYFKADGIECMRANISEGLPLEDESVDAVICQEGIEHFSDQLGAFKEFSRIIKINGILLITTPNYSNLRSKLSYLLSESERFNSTMPPNELDSIWMNKQDVSSDIYFGHIFLIGIQKLRVLAKLSGFRIKKHHFTRYKSTSLLLFPIFYPFIFLSNWISYRKNMKKNKEYSHQIKKDVYGEVFRLSVNPKILTGGNLMVEFNKEKNPQEVNDHLKSGHKEFGVT